MGIKSKKGWIRIVEAFVAILLIAAALLMTINRGALEKDNTIDHIYEYETSILRGIELNQGLRNEILNLDNVPVEWNDFPENVRNEIVNKIPAYLNCEGQICDIDDDCFIDDLPQKDIYVRSTIISANLEIYNPRQLKLFCWDID